MNQFQNGAAWPFSPLLYYHHSQYLTNLGLDILADTCYAVTMKTQQLLRRYFENHGITQRDAAARMGICPEHLNRVLTGRDPLSTKFIGNFAVTFGWDSAWEAFGEGPIDNLATDAQQSQNPSRR